jgi:hypothetical protein
MKLSVRIDELAQVVLTVDGEDALKSYIQNSPLNKDPFKKMKNPSGERVIIAPLWDLMSVFGYYVINKKGIFKNNKIYFGELE